MRNLLAFLALAPASALAVPSLESVAVNPNPGPLRSGTEAVITVTIKRPGPLDWKCQATITPGDGGRVVHVDWDLGDPRTRTTRHTYRKPGTYFLTVAGKGNDACAGKVQAKVIVK